MMMTMFNRLIGRLRQSIVRTHNSNSNNNIGGIGTDLVRLQRRVAHALDGPVVGDLDRHRLAGVPGEEVEHRVVVDLDVAARSIQLCVSPLSYNNNNHNNIGDVPDDDDD